MRISVDFDGVIFDKREGTVIDGAAAALRSMKIEGHEITVFTNRPDYDYSSVKAILDGKNIPYHRIICGKPSYDLFIDDSAVKFTGWGKEYV